MTAGQTTRPVPPEPATSPDAPTHRATRIAGLVARHRLVWAAAGGILLVFAFPPYDLWPLAPVAVAVFCLAVSDRSPGRAAGIGLVFGLAFFVPLLSWSGVYVGPAPWLILAASQAVFVAALGAATALVWRAPAGPLFAAALWVGCEAARDRVPFGGFPWGRLAFSQADGAYTPIAALGGAPLLTFAVALTGCLLARALVPHGTPGWRPRGGLAAGGVIVGLIGLVLAPTLPDGSGGDHPVVAVIQGNVPRLGLDFDAQRAAVLRNHVNGTIDLAQRVRAGTAPTPVAVIWPENSSDLDPYAVPEARAEIDRAARAVGVPILVGAIKYTPDGHRLNRGIVWDPETGPGQSYDKRHPVPFAEYIPLRGLARMVSDKVDLVSSDMIGGHDPGVLRLGPLTVGDVICFEVAYDGLVRDTVTGGGQLLIVQTNNATFGRTAETYQQLAMSRVRAVEHGRTVVVSSTSGVSAVIGPDGRVRWETGILTADTFDDSVSVRGGHTVATRLGALPEWILSALGVGALGSVIAAGVRHRGLTGTTRTSKETA